MDRFEEAKKALMELYEKGAELDGEVSHALNTLDWLCKLTDAPSEYLMLAALGHDIERCVPPRESQAENEDYDIYKKRHSDRCAVLIKAFSLKHGYNQDEATRIAELVRLHEVGGDLEVNLLQDADSISYFDNNLERYFKRSGYEKTVAKVKWMFDRCSVRAQKIIRELPTYQKFIKRAS